MRALGFKLHTVHLAVPSSMVKELTTYRKVDGQDENLICLSAKLGLSCPAKGNQQLCETRRECHQVIVLHDEVNLKLMVDEVIGEFEINDSKYEKTHDAFWDGSTPYITNIVKHNHRVFLLLDPKQLQVSYAR